MTWTRWEMKRAKNKLKTSNTVVNLPWLLYIKCLNSHCFFKVLKAWRRWVCRSVRSHSGIAEPKRQYLKTGTKMNQYGRIFFMYINTNYFQTVLWLNKQQLKHICLTCSYMLTMLYERKMFAEGTFRFRVNWHSNNRKYCGFSLHQSLLYTFALLWWRALVRIISNSFHYFGSWKAFPYFLYFCKSITDTLTACDGLEDVI